MPADSNLYDAPAKASAAPSGLEEQSVRLSFWLCILLEVLPIEADLLLFVRPMGRYLLFKFAFTALILAPLLNAYWHGSTPRGLLRHKRAWFVFTVMGIHSALAIAVSIKSDRPGF